MTKRIALSVGDPNGIGPEIVLRALAALAGETRLSISVFGPPQVLERAAVVTGLQDLLPSIDMRPAGELPAVAAVPGQVNAAAGSCAVAAASCAIRACQAGSFDAVVAGPHHETAIHQAGIRFSGYPSLVLFAVVFAWLVLGQGASPVQLFGGLFVVAGIALVRLDELREPASDTPVPTREPAPTG